MKRPMMSAIELLIIESSILCVFLCSLSMDDRSQVDVVFSDQVERAIDWHTDIRRAFG